MSTLRLTTISNQSGSATVPSETVINGSAKLWVSFNGSGTVAIRASFNVSSITDVGTGQYTINFTTALADANYAVALSTTDLNSGGASSQYAYVSDITFPRTSSAFRFVSLTANGAAFFDAQYLTCVVFR
jgi:hypothetical protein